MDKKIKENRWQRWEEEVEKFKSAMRDPPPETNVRHWQRYLMFIFMQELSKNVLNEKESLDSIMEKIIEALQMGCGFTRVRIYLAKEREKSKRAEMHLYKTSKGHDSTKSYLKLTYNKGGDNAVDVFFTKQPLAAEDISKLKLKYKERLTVAGPYAVIPLFIESAPYGLIFADTVSPEISSKITHIVKYLEYKEHFDTFARTIMASIENRKVFEQKNELLNFRDKLLVMLQNALREAHDLNAVLKIIRDSCSGLISSIDLKNLCLSTRDPESQRLTTPFDKCFIPQTDCKSCIEGKPIIQEVLNTGNRVVSKDKIALPISLKKDIIGVLYLEGRTEVFLTDNEEKILDIITNTAGILITTARNYEKKIKQGAALHEAGQLSTKKRDFREMFHPVMKNVMGIIGKENRNFHLVMAENLEGGKKLVVRGSSDLFIEEEQKKIYKRDKLIGIEIPIEKEKSLCGLVLKEKEIKIIHNIGENEKLPEGHPDKLPFYKGKLDEIIPKFEIKAEVVIPLKIKTVPDEDNVIGFLVIDSIQPDDFYGLDIRFIETIADYIAITIHNQQLYEERANYQEELSRIDRRVSVNTILRFFYHEFKDSIQNLLIRVEDIEAGQAIDQEDIDFLRKQTNEQFKIFERFQNAFITTAPRREQRQIRELIQKSINAIAITIGIDIKLEGNYQDADYKVECYPDHIDLAFRAIINNAVKFSRQVDRKKKYLKIDVYPTKKEDRINISFESATIAQISKEEKKLIFQPFKRGTDKEAGEGLGLAIADLCIKRHNGEIAVENVGDDAIRFTITLPFSKYKNKGGIIKW
jgi:signal transduction histidine kinase